MELIAIGGRRLEQLGVDQHLEGVGGMVHGGSEQGGSARQPDGQARPASQEAERMRGIDPVRKVRARQARKAHLEAGPHREVTGLQLIEPAPLV